MKRSLIASMVFGGLLAFGSTAWSLPLSVDVEGVTYEVGVVDIFIAKALGSLFQGAGGTDPNKEAEWASDELGFEVVFYDKTEFSSSTILNLWHETNEEEGSFAFELSGSPEYYLVKTGGGPQTYTHFLFQNLAELSWAVIALEGMDYTISEIQKISHLSEFNNNPIPEPTTLILLGSGLAGLALANRRRKA